MIAALLGAAFGLGLVLVAGGVRRSPRPSNAALFAQLLLARAVYTQAVRGRSALQLAAGFAAAALVAATTRWPVATVLAALAVWTLPGTLAGAERRRARRLASLEAVASWTESLAATLRGAAGLEQTIIRTAATAPPAIRPQVTALADALRRGAPLPDALRAFAADVADPLADTVVAALVFAATEGAGRLAEPLQLLAAATRDEVSARRRIERSRGKATTDGRIIVGTTLVMTVGLLVFQRDTVQAFGTVQGQIVLALVGAGFTIGFRWLSYLSAQDEPDRILGVVHEFEKTDAASVGNPRWGGAS